MAGFWRNLPFLLRRTIVSSAQDGVFGIAKGAAYSSLLSFFPLLTSAAAVLVEVRADFVTAQLTGFLSEILPPGTDEVVVSQLQLRGGRPIGLLVGALVVALWAASSVIKSLIDGFHVAYRVPRNRGFFHSTAISMLIVLAAALPFIVASSLVLFGQQAEAVMLSLLKVDPILNPLTDAWETLSRIARYGLALAATTSLMSILYYFGPYRRQRFHRVVPGAILATLLWLGATTGFGWYMKNLAHYNVVYGSIGTGIALLVWMYLLCAIAIVGCEFNADYERRFALESNCAA
jgi:membrane protein